jgi:hypothetical protein
MDMGVYVRSLARGHGACTLVVHFIIDTLR